jgi:hypothetical protein
MLYLKQAQGDKKQNGQMITVPRGPKPIIGPILAFKA